jgi:hypothetical protein
MRNQRSVVRFEVCVSTEGSKQKLLELSALNFVLGTRIFKVPIPYKAQSTKLKALSKSFPQILRKSMWKSTLMILQSCYKRTFTTFCTRQRRTQNSFYVNELTLSVGLLVQRCHCHSKMERCGENLFVDHRRMLQSHSILLIVGADKINSPNRRRTVF